MHVLVISTELNSKRDMRELVYVTQCRIIGCEYQRILYFFSDCTSQKGMWRSSRVSQILGSGWTFPLAHTEWHKGHITLDMQKQK